MAHHAVSAFLLAVLLVGSAPPVLGQDDAYRQDDGRIDGAPYRVRVPRNWNGTFLVYTPGYRDKAEGGEPGRDVLAPPVTIAPDLTIAGDGQMEDDLLARGYALAGSRYRDDGVLLDGVTDTLNLVRHVREVVAKDPAVLAAGTLRRLILVGCSLGAAHVARIVETTPSALDGAITLGLPGAGLPRTADYLLAFQLAYDVTFGWPPDWGEVGDVRNAEARQKDLDWEEETLPRMALQSSDPRNRGRFEFIRMVLGLPLEGFYPGPEADPGHIPWLYAVTLFATEAAAEGEHRLGGLPYRNVAHRYSLSQAERDYLRSLDPTLDADGLLTRMNDRTTYRADGRARALLDAAFGFEGRIGRPVIAMHNTSDGIMPVWHANLYRKAVEEAGQENRLVQVFVRRPSHCAFTVSQVVTAAEAIEAWIDSGRPPAAGAFPEHLGFDQDYSPPRWPFDRERRNTKTAQYSP